MRRGFYLSTALITTLRRDVLSAELPEFDVLLDWRPSDDPAAPHAGRISSRSLCSDGEIFLEGELPYQILLRS